MDLEAREIAFEMLQEQVEDIDNARDFNTIGGFPAVLRALAEDPAPRLQAAAAWVAGTAVQNNRELQLVLVEQGALPTLLRLVGAHAVSEVRAEALTLTLTLARAPDPNPSPSPSPDPNPSPSPSPNPSPNPIALTLTLTRCAPRRSTQRRGCCAPAPRRRRSSWPTTGCRWPSLTPGPGPGPDPDPDPRPQP